MFTERSRRASIGLPLLFLILVLGAPLGAAERLLVAVGDVASSTAVLWVRGVTDGVITAEYGPAGDGPTGTASVRVTDAGDRTGKALLSGLRPATRYTYRARSQGAGVAGEFVTAPPDDSPTPVRFLWSGDLGGGGVCRPRNGSHRIFEAMARQRPDFFLFVGDTIYADHVCRGPGVEPGGAFRATTLAGFRAKYRYYRLDAALGRLLTRTSVSAIWDDHEVRNDFAGPNEPLMPLGRQAFLDYWPILPPTAEPTRLYRALRWGRLLEVFILDTRQYRSANSELDGPAKTMLGSAQRRWLIDQVSASPAVWKVIVTSVSLSVPTGRTHRDSWSNASVWGLPEENSTGFAVERDTILRTFRQRGVRNLVFLTADVHHAELIRHHPTPEFSFHEFIAGPLAASQGRPRPLDAALNPRSLFGRGGLNTFGEVRIEPTLFTVRIVDEDGRGLFTHTIGPD
ncbi:MAG: alkaline phosphatase D family protein [Candidatus Rokuibacteriota bacterium]